MNYNLSMDSALFLEDFFQRFQPLPDKPIVVAVSGGADSLCLLDMLKGSGLRLIPAHFDHQLREVSANQAEQLLSLLDEWGLDCEAASADVRAFAKQNKFGIEEAARICRYQFLAKTAEKYQAQAILTAHHRDDQVETVLMHFLRGSGINGLAGIRPVEFLTQFSEKIPVWRPLLNTTKEDILGYCKEHGLEVLEDESNQDRRYYRNRLRHEVIPILEEVQPAFRSILSRNAAVIDLDRQLLNRLADFAWESCLIKAEEQVLIFDHRKWLGTDQAIQYRLLMKAANCLVPHLRDLGFAELQRAKIAIDQATEHLDFKAGIMIQTQDEKLIISLGEYQSPREDLPQLTGYEVRKLSLKKPLKLQAGWEIRAELIDAKIYKKLAKSVQQDPMHAWLNPADLDWPLTVRPATAGERWSPLGMVHKRQKLSDFYINQKIPRTARQLWPVVSNAGSILWLVGLRISQAWRLTGNESEVLHLELLSPEGFNQSKELL
jgi:tRNA(Ile)-lysidine synthase